MDLNLGKMGGAIEQNIEPGSKSVPLFSNLLFDLNIIVRPKPGVR